MAEYVDPILAEIRKLKTEHLAKIHELETLEREQLEDTGHGSGATDGLWHTFDEMLALRIATRERFGTGFKLLDEKLDGGLYPPNLITIQGKPGVGKTMFAIQVARHIGRRCAVASFFADEGEDGAAVAMAQQLGADRNALIRADVDAVRLAAEKMTEEARFFRSMDPGHPDATLEILADEFERMAPTGLQRLWLIDSAQTLRLAEPGAPREDEWAFIRRAIKTLRLLTIKARAITILISHVGRSAYKEKKEENQSDPLASAAGSALIERNSELLIHLDGNPTREEPRVALRVVKNRISLSGNFVLPLSIDWPRKSFTEVDPSAEEREKVEKHTVDLSRVRDKILAVLTGRDGVTGAVLEKEVGGRRALVREARLELAVEGKIHAAKRKGRGGGEEWFLGEGSAEVLTFKSAPKPATSDLFENREEGEDHDVNR